MNTNSCELKIILQREYEESVNSNGANINFKIAIEFFRSFEKLSEKNLKSRNFVRKNVKKSDKTAILRNYKYIFTEILSLMS